MAALLQNWKDEGKTLRWSDKAEIKCDQSAQAKLRESLLLFPVIRGTGYFGTWIVQDVWHKVQSGDLWDWSGQKSSIWPGYCSFTEILCNTLYKDIRKQTAFFWRDVWSEEKESETCPTTSSAASARSRQNIMALAMSSLPAASSLSNISSLCLCLKDVYRRVVFVQFNWSYKRK